MSEWKPGALVMCKGGTPNLAHRAFAGTVRRLGCVVSDDCTGQHWRLDPPTLAGGLNLQWTRSYLRLIDDPGADAQDETLTWLPSPVLEAA